MADQAESLRRLVQARRDWEELAEETPAPRPAGRREADAAWNRARVAARLLGIGARPKPGESRT